MSAPELQHMKLRPIAIILLIALFVGPIYAGLSVTLMLWRLRHG